MKPRPWLRIFCLLPALFGSGCATYPPEITQGYLLQSQGNWDGAIGAYGHVIQGDADQSPALWHAFTGRGWAYYNKGLFAQALADYDKAVSMRVSVASDELSLLHYMRALALYNLGRFQEAADDSQKALTLKNYPRWADDYDGDLMVRAGSLAFLKQDSEALEIFDQYTQQHPQGLPDAYLFAQGLAYFHTGRLDAAHAIANRLLDTWPVFSIAFSGEHELEMFDLDKRVATIKKSLDDARTAESVGQWPFAFQSWQMAWSNGWPGMPEYQEIRNHLLSVYLKLAEKPALPEAGRRLLVEAKTFLKTQADPGSEGYSKALGCYNGLLSAFPWYADGYYNVALISAQLNRYDWAIPNMKAYLQLAPDAPDARAAQDKIYEWEAKSK